MPAPAATIAPVTIVLDEVLKLHILGNSGLGVKFNPESVRDQDSQELTIRLIDRVTTACKQVGRFPSLFVDFSEVPRLPKRLTSALVDLMESGIRPGADFFYCGVEAGSTVHAELEESGLLSVGFLDPGTSFIPASAEDREKFGRLATALRGFAEADDLTSALFQERKN